jgi:copper(I)-binding protein
MRRLLLVAAAAAIPVLAGCEAGDNAPTIEFHYPTDAAGLVAGQIAIRNVFVLGGPLGSALRPGQSASLFFSLINDGTADRLLSITAPGTATAVKLPGGSVAVNPFKPVLFNGPAPEAYLVGLTRTITGGSDVRLVLHFQKQGAVAIEVPVFPAASHYATYSPPPSPAATTASKHSGVTPSASASARGTPSLTPTPSPSAT